MTLGHWAAHIAHIVLGALGLESMPRHLPLFGDLHMFAPEALWLCFTAETVPSAPALLLPGVGMVSV